MNDYGWMRGGNNRLFQYERLKLQYTETLLTPEAERDMTPDEAETALDDFVLPTLEILAQAGDLLRSTLETLVDGRISHWGDTRGRIVEWLTRYESLATQNNETLTSEQLKT